MKYFNLKLFAFIFVLLLSCNKEANSNGGNAPGKGKVTVKLKVKGLNAPTDFFIFQSLGYDHIELGKVNLQANAEGIAEGTIQVDIPAEGVYLLGNSKQNTVMLILDAKENPKVELNFPQISSDMKVQNSPANEQLQKFLKEISEYQAQYGQMQQKYFFIQDKNSAEAVALKAHMDTVLIQQALSEEKWMNDKNTHPVLKRLITLYYFAPYNPEKHKQYKDEKEYFVKGFWEKTNLQDSLFGYIPATYDKMNYYVSTLLQIFPNDAKGNYAKLKEVLQKAPEKTTLRKMLYYAIAVATYNKDKDLFVLSIADLGKEFPNDKLYNQVKGEIEAAKKTAIGSVAPDIELPTPDGKTMKISDLRGKYVLLDFWASWCAPCRRENPNVVRMYKKYKDKGFEILGISLDKSKDKWIQAIQSDGLTWYHISDLKGWQSAAAKLYGVNSIPSTFLLDKEGRIIAKNLRGPALEQKLKELLGE